MTFKWQFKHDLTAQTLADTVLGLQKRSFSVQNGASNFPMLETKRTYVSKPCCPKQCHPGFSVL